MNAFTYGTLMFPEVIGNLTHGKIYEKKNATLKAYGRRHVKDKVYPGIVISANE